MDKSESRIETTNERIIWILVIFGNIATKYKYAVARICDGQIYTIHGKKANAMPMHQQQRGGRRRAEEDAE